MAEVQTLGRVAKPRNPLYQGGKDVRLVHAEVNVDASEIANGDVFILAEGLSIGARVHRLFAPAGHPALTAAADNDFGFYKRESDGTLTALDVDALVDGADFTSADGVAQDLLNENSALDRTKNIGELLGLNADEAPSGGIILAWTMNTKSTADGVVDIDVAVEYPTTN